jgi:hypothetical protein
MWWIGGGSAFLASVPHCSVFPPRHEWRQYAAGFDGGASGVEKIFSTGTRLTSA